jgi:hypothetical protein
VLFAKRLRPVVVELASSAYQLVDAVTATVATRREDMDDLLAEARAQASTLRAEKAEPSPPPRRPQTRRPRRPARRPTAARA